MAIAPSATLDALDAFTAENPVRPYVEHGQQQREDDRQAQLRCEVGLDEVVDDAEREAARDGAPDRAETADDRCDERVDHERVHYGRRELRRRSGQNAG